MAQNQMDFIKGALIGGVIGGIAGLLLAPKSGQELRDSITDGYSSAVDNAQDFANDLKEKGRKLIYKEEEEKSSPATILTGGAVGAVIGAIAALLLAPHSGKVLREELGEKYDEIREKAEDFVSALNDKSEDLADKIEDWKDTLKVIVDKLAKSGAVKEGKSKIEEITDWAHLGMELFQKMKKRR